jgi:hypothetical protein
MEIPTEQADDHSQGSDSDAVFLGYQKTKDGREIPLFNIVIQHHPLNGSTVTEERLQSLDLRVPEKILYDRML